MKNQDINIRDPFVLLEDGKYYMYGTRAASFGYGTAGFDVYVSDDLETWSDPIAVFDSATCGMNDGVNWAPEVHKYGDAYYMFATFTQKNGLRGTYILKADAPTGPFQPHSAGAVTPDGWECLDGTLYVEDGIALIAIVGQGMAYYKGIAARIFQAITDANVNIRMIDQGSSELNIIVGVAEEDYEAAIRSIYSAVIEKK